MREQVQVCQKGRRGHVEVDCSRLNHPTCVVAGQSEGKEPESGNKACERYLHVVEVDGSPLLEDGRRPHALPDGGVETQVAVLLAVEEGRQRSPYGERLCEDKQSEGKQEESPCG